MMKIIFLILISIPLFCVAQDSLNIRYSIVQMEYQPTKDIIKIKVPGWLKTSELMEQIRRVVIWPNEPLPKKKTYVYVFKETDQLGTTSRTGAVYIPDYGFLWDLREWEPDDKLYHSPTARELLIYYALVDSIITRGATLDNTRIRHQISRQFSISVGQLDTLYSRVKYWLENDGKLESPGGAEAGKKIRDLRTKKQTGGDTIQNILMNTSNDSNAEGDHSTKANNRSGNSI